jgi:hypothetical protein
MPSLQCGKIVYGWAVIQDLSTCLFRLAGADEENHRDNSRFIQALASFQSLITL